MIADKNYVDILALKRVLGKTHALDELANVLLRRAPVQDEDNRDSVVRRWLDAVRVPGEVAP